MPTQNLEREVKLDVDLNYALPDLDGVGYGVSAVELPSAELVATYYDTPDRRLISQGVTLRHRRDRAVKGDLGEWTLKLPAPPSGTALERTELTWSGKDTALPDEARRLVLGIVRRAELGPVVKLTTTRHRFGIEDRADRRLAEIDDDTVAVMDGRKLVERFREVEVELNAGDEELLDSVVARLGEAGARRSAQQPKVARALGIAPATEAAPEPATMTLSEVAALACRTGLERLLTHDPWVRLGGESEHIHQARVATRRLRSDLRTFGDSLDADWTTSMRADLRWVGAALGEVRDADVLALRLETQWRDQLTGDDPEGLEELRARLSAEREEAYQRLLVVLASDRYLHAVDALAGGPPPLSAKHGRQPDEPAKQALGPVVERSWKKLRRAVDNLGHRPSDAELHQIRIKAKQLRYGSEAAAVVVGTPALKLADVATELQDILGEHHDAVAAEAWLRSQAGALGAPGAFVAGELVMVQRHEQARLRRHWRPVWRSLRAKRLRRWLG